MIRIRKRHFALLLVYVMVLMMLPVPTRADDTSEPATQTEETDCAHENTIGSISPFDAPRYEQWNASEHSVYHTMDIDCATCGKNLGSEEFVSQEAHVLNDNGVCTYCGYGAGDDYCSHPATERLWDTTYPMTCTMQDSACHKIVGYQYYSCTSCFEPVSSSFPATSIESHVLDADGNCTLCGNYTGSCSHPDYEIAWDTTQAITYTMVNESLHAIAGYQYTYCTSCLVRTSAGYVSGVLANHVLDADGNCTLCDMRAECTHSVTRTVQNGTPVYTPIDGNYHMVTTYFSKVCANQSCGKVLETNAETFTKKEYHSWDYIFGNCLVCNYPDTAALTVSVATSSQTAAKGDLLSATASASGGSGSYQYNWKVLLNGAAISETGFSTGSSYSYTASDTGTYIFAVTVQDSSGTSVTAQSGSITVSHIHNYETISSETSLVMHETYHDVVTTSYQKCTTCQAISGPIVVSVRENHKAESYGYKAEHPHQRFFVCECGAEPYVEDAYQTANGNVQDAAVCCLCHGHSFGEAVEVTAGNWRKTCTSCGIIQRVEAPAAETVPEETESEETVPVETHSHDLKIGFVYDKNHPHLSRGSCSICGLLSTCYITLPDCCECNGGHHNWGDAIRLPDGSFKEVCANCNATQTVKPSSKVQTYYKVIDMIIYRRNVASQYQIQHSVDSAASAIWKTIAEQATDKLMDADFVTTTETLNTFSDMSGSILGIFTEESWNEQQIGLWKSLLIQLLQNQEGSGESSEYVDFTEDSRSIFSDVVEVVEKIHGVEYDQLMENGKQLRDKLTVVYGKLDELAETDNLPVGSDMSQSSALAELLLESRKDQLEGDWNDVLDEATDEKYNEWLMHDFGLFMDAVDIALEGADKAAVKAQYNQTLANLKNATEYVGILDKIIEIAEESGNTNLAAAATELQEDLAREIAGTANHLLSNGAAFFAGCAEGATEFAIDKGLDALTGSYSGVLTILQLGAKGLSSLLNWNDAYDAAQKLMTINQMDATLNVVQILKNEEAPYMAELWGLLQAEGCTQAQNFLNEWEKGTTLDSTDLGIEEGDLSKVIRQLEAEWKYYLTALNLTIADDD